jgi:hypothetical protein
MESIESIESILTNGSFAQKISLEEYNKQKKDYTEKALLELKAQIATYKPNDSISHNNSESEYESDSNDNSNDNSNDKSNDNNEFVKESSGVNVIIKNYNDSTKQSAKQSSKTNTGLRRRKIQQNIADDDKRDLSSSIYVQRELELQDLHKVKNQLKKMRKLLEEEEGKNHYLKLDLCNAQVDNIELKKVLCIRETKIKYLEEKHKSEMWLVINLKLLISFLVVLYIYKFLF